MYGFSSSPGPGYSPAAPRYYPYNYSGYYEPGPELCLRFPDKRESESLDARFDQSPVYTQICEGGPLITDTGYVIGINFKDAHSLPAAVILSCLEMWRSFGTVVRPWFGMSIVDVDQLSDRIWERYNIPVEGSYVVVKEVLKGSIADENDVHPGDLVSTCNGVSIRSAKQYSQLLSEASQVLTACADSSQQSFTAPMRSANLKIFNFK